MNTYLSYRIQQEQHLQKMKQQQVKKIKPTDHA